MNFEAPDGGEYASTEIALESTLFPRVLLAWTAPRHQQSCCFIEHRLNSFVFDAQIFEQLPVRRLWRNEGFALMDLVDVSFHIARVHELLAAVLAVECLVKMITESLLAQLFVADATDEVLWVALKVLADVHLQRLLGSENRVAVLASRFSSELAQFVF